MIAGLRARLPAAVLVAILFLSFVGFSPVAVFGNDESLAGTQSSDGDALRQVGFLLCLAAIGAHLTLARGARALLDVPPAFLVLMGWCWLSLLWAVDPGVSLRRLILATSLILSVTWTVRCMSFDDVFRTLCGFCAALLIADWLSIPLLRWATHQPSEIESDLAGAWRGFHRHKNEAGGFCAIAAILFAYASWRARSFVTGPFLVALAAGFLAMSQSKTAAGFTVAALIAGLCAQAGYANPGLRKGAAVLLVAALSLLTAFAPGVFADAFALFDDPGSFTGRTQIWPVMLAYAADHPLLGSGYGSFWAIGEQSPVFDYGAGWIRLVFQAHDGYLDVLAQIGGVGLAIVLLGLVARPLAALFSEPLAADSSRFLLAAVLSFIWLRDLLETSLIDRANPAWVVAVVVYCLLAKARRAPAEARREMADVSAALMSLRRGRAGRRAPV